MFILEESQLLEDTIKDERVLGLYRTLRKNEATNERAPFIDEILAHSLSEQMLRTTVQFYETNDLLSLSADQESCKKFSPEQRDQLCEQLALERDDIAALALVVSASLTQLFAIDNHVGPSNEGILRQSYSNLPKSLADLSKRINYQALSKDACEVYHRILNPWFLRVVQLLWLLMNSLGCSRRLLELEFLVWRHRYLALYSMALLDSVESVLSELKKLQEHIFDHYILSNTVKDTNTQLTRFNVVHLCCELSQGALLRDGLTVCRKFSDYASELSGVTVQYTGVLGRRTRFQQKDVPQLVVKVDQGQSEPGLHSGDHVVEVGCKNLPKDIKLDDDTLLPDISFVKKDQTGNEVDGQSLCEEAQVLLLIGYSLMMRTEAMEESLKDEWALAYLRSITKSASIWTLKYKALAERSNIERKFNRKMDRALLQLEELIKEVETNNSDNLHRRMHSFYSVLPLPLWQVQKSFGDISYGLGLIKNALDIYQRLEFWEGMIKCYSALGQTVKAEKLIRQELAKNETPYLYCLLGDATDNVDDYEKSWSLSKCRFARAKKSIGTHYYVRKLYAEAIDNYEQALSANPSNIGILSMLAYSCLTLERYERAAECYRNITYLDDSNFLAWNNLSKAYIKLGQHERAWRTLREAIRCSYEEWKVWENFMVVSIQIGALDDVIQAWHRLIDLKSGHKDDSMLGALTHLLLKRPSEKVDEKYMKLLTEALKLVARLISTSDSSPRVWTCYFKLMIREYDLLVRGGAEVGAPSLTKMEADAHIAKITNALQRATPNLTLNAAWFQEINEVDRTLDKFHELVDCYSCAIEIIGPRAEIWRQWKYFKMSATNALKTLEQKGFSRV